MPAGTKIVSIHSLSPHPRNPNKHPETQVEALAESAEKYDQTRNIIVWNGLILAGEGYWRGARRAGVTDIEVKDVSEWPESKALAYMFDDNHLAEKSELSAEDTVLLLDMTDKAGEHVISLTDAERAELVKTAKRAKRNHISLVKDASELLDAPAADAPTGDATPPSKPSSASQKFPLAIVLTAEQNRQWGEYKASIKMERNDMGAFWKMFTAMQAMNKDGIGGG